VALDIIVVKMIIDFSSRPLRWFGLLSVPGFIVGFGFLVLALDMYSDHRMDSMMVPLIMSLLSLFSSGNLLTVGVVGELSIKTSDFIGRKLFLPLGKCS
jgi:hypothetical protein